VTPYPILEIISLIKKYNKRAKIIIGGPYVLNQVITSDPVSIQYLFKYIGADFYVVGSEGEFALAKIIQALKRASSFDDIDNIAYKNGNHYRLTAQTGEDNSLEENTVNYNLFPKEEIGEFVSLRTSKSCPFACAFCGFPERGGKYKYLSSDLVEQELNAIRDLGKVTTLTFIDDTFNVPQKRFKEILRMMIRNKYEFKWNCYYRCDHGDEETIALMREAGCEGVFLGVESGSDDILKRMNKRARRKDYLETIPKFRAFDISTHASLIVGFPGETHKTMRETRGLIEETKPDFFRAQLWYYDPITPVWKQREEYGIKGAGFEWSHKTMDSSTACELAEEMFLSVENAIWLPQNGFEQWSTFYLQRKGLTLTQIKTFLRCYNAIIKDQLIYPERQTVDPDLLDNLARSCQLHDPVRRDIHPLPINTGTGGDDGAHAQGKERRLRAAIEKEVFRF
jgi:radical SAM PhpK family P-methyltransferase